MSLFDFKFIEENVLGNSELEEVLSEVERVCNTEVLLTEKKNSEEEEKKKGGFTGKKMELVEKIDRMIQNYIFDEDAGADAVVKTLKAMKAKVEETTGEKNVFSGKDSDIYNEEIAKFNALVDKKLSELKKT